MNFFIREGISSDMTSVLMLIKELAKIKNIEGTTSITVYDLIRDCFSSENRFNILVAEKNNEIIGFALYTKTYSIYGKSLILEDIYVAKKHRENGIGLSLFAKFLDIARINKITRLEWTLLKRQNSLVPVYEKTGANINWDSAVYTVGQKKINWFLDQYAHKTIDAPFKNIVIRNGEMRDMLSVVELFNEIALEKNTVCNLNVYDLIKDGFSDKPLFKTIVLEIGEEIVGMLLFFHSYATFKGKSIIYEELYLKEKYRNYGLEGKMTAKLFKYTLKNNFVRIQKVINKLDAESKKRCASFGGEMEKDMFLVQISYEALHDFITK